MQSLWYGAECCGYRAVEIDSVTSIISGAGTPPRPHKSKHPLVGEPRIGLPRNGIYLPLINGSLPSDVWWSEVMGK